MQMLFFSVYRPHKESISKEINNNELNSHRMIKLSGWLRYTDADINQNALQAENFLALFLMDHACDFETLNEFLVV